MKFLVFLLLLLPCWSVLVQAQKTPLPPPPDAPVQTARTELPLSTDNSEAHVQALPADSSVVILLGRDRPFSSKVSFFFLQYDRDLRLRRERPVEVPDEFQFTRICSEGTAVFALFSSRTMPGRLWAMAFDGLTGAVRTQQFETRLSREIVELKALDGTLFATVLLADHLHVTAILLNIATGQMQYLPSVYEEIPTQFTFVADAASGRAEYVVTQTNGRKTRLLLKQLTDRGQLLRSEFVQAESERNLITAQLSPPQDTTARLLTGTYSLRDPNYAQGLFATDLSASPDGPKASLRFYDFLRLKHFFDFLNPRRQARLRLRIDRREARSVAPLRWHYRLLLHELVPLAGGGYALVAEVYYPHYRYNSYSGSLSPVGSGPTGPYASSRVFDGYQTTHVVVCGFDRQGTLLWDNTFVVDNLRRYELEETVRLRPLEDGRLVLAYLDENKLRYKLINRAEATPNDLQVPLQTNGPSIVEKTTNTEQADLLPWFGSRFLASGYQKVRSATGAEREVFFLNSVVFTP